LAVFVASMLSERLLASVVGSGSISDILVSISENLTRMRISNLVALVNSLGIVVLAVLFYIVFNEQYKIIALVALGCFLAEAITLAVSKIGAYALIPLSQEFVEAGAPEPSYLQTLGDFLYYGVDRRGYDIHMRYCQMLWITPQWRRRPMGSERISDPLRDPPVASGPLHPGTSHRL
jgi:multidrug transporter EmrE-like cation transporter